MANEQLKNEIKKIKTFKRKTVIINFERCEFCGKTKQIGKPCVCKYGGVFG